MSWVSRLEKIKDFNEDRNSEKDEDKYIGSSIIKNDVKYEKIRENVHREIVEKYNEIESENELDQKAYVMNLIHESLAHQEERLTRVEEAGLSQEILDDVIGLGPIEPFLKDDSISEIMVNDPEHVYVERAGKLEFTAVTFRDDEHVLQIIDRIVSRVGRRCDESTPMVDARLEDGSRVNAVIPPVALKGPSLTIRKFSKSPLKISDLISFGSMSIEMANFLEAAVKGKCNIIVAGGTGSGKTTLLNVLSDFIPENERIVTIEDAAELQLEQEHVVTLEGRPENIEGKGRVSIRDLVKNALRMRPDRIIVGEVRSGEALDMLQAMNTGHDGSLTTVHANSPRDVAARLETMVLMAGFEIPTKAVREQITSAIDLIVQQNRFRDGSRKIVNISEVLAMEGDTIVMQDIFTYRQTTADGQGKVTGYFDACGIHPKVVEKIRYNGAICKDDWFLRRERV